MMSERDLWARLKQPSPRGKYEHVKSWNRRNRRRASFVRRIERAPGGCWVWTGQVSKTNGRVYPTVAFRVTGNRSIQRSAFLWLVDEFLPELAPLSRHRTTPRCGVSLCIHPGHRADARVTRQLITADQAREIYAAKGVKNATDVAQAYGVSRNQVYAVWRGRNWRVVTGAPPHTPRRRVYTDDEVQRVLNLKGTGSSRKVAAQLDVHYKFVLAVWAGLRTRQGA